MPTWNKYLPSILDSLRGQGFTIDERGSGEGLAYEHTIIAVKGYLTLNITIPSTGNVKATIDVDGTTLPQKTISTVASLEDMVYTIGDARTMNALRSFASRFDIMRRLGRKDFGMVIMADYYIVDMWKEFWIGTARGFFSYGAPRDGKDYDYLHLYRKGSEGIVDFDRKMDTSLNMNDQLAREAVDLMLAGDGDEFLRWFLSRVRVQVSGSDKPNKMEILRIIDDRLARLGCRTVST